MRRGANIQAQRPLRDVARKPRQEMDGAVLHVFARGDNRRPIFHDDADRRLYLSILGRVTSEYDWHCLAYCLMPNHVHLLVETPKANLGAGIQQLHGSYGQLFNRRRGGCGHVFQGRYGAVRVESDNQLWTVLAYIARNPVEAGLCEHASQWPWSSHRAFLGYPYPAWVGTQRLREHMRAVGGRSHERYSDLVDGQH